jgi:hypothetical protein
MWTTQCPLRHEVTEMVRETQRRGGTGGAELSAAAIGTGLLESKVEVTSPGTACNGDCDSLC